MEATNDRSQSRTAEDIDNEDINSQNITPKNPNHVLELSSEDDRSFFRSYRKKKPSKKRVVETSDDDDKISNLVQPRKKIRLEKNKKRQCSPIVDNNSKDSLPPKLTKTKPTTGGPSKKSNNTRKNAARVASPATDDSDIKIIEKETPEKELGMSIQ